MAKKNENLLPLPEVPPGLAIDVNVAHIAKTNKLLAATDNRRYLDDSLVQIATMEAAKVKAAVGIKAIAQVQRYAAATYYETLVSMSHVQKKAKGTENQGYFEEFVHYLKQVSAQDTIAVVSFVTPTVTDQMVLPPFSPAPEGRKGFLARVFGA